MAAAPFVLLKFEYEHRLKSQVFLFKLQIPTRTFEIFELFSSVLHDCSRGV